MAIPAPAPISAHTRARPPIARHLLAFLVITVASIGVNGWHLNDALGWSDGPNHLFDGIFLYEFAKDMPLDQPRAWAEQFYLRHPSLGIIVYWPPGFAAMEALTFAIFGVSLLAARMLVLAFVIGTGMAMYGLGRQLFNNNGGLYAALVLIATPAGVRWAGDVMLEWPATFWMTLALIGYVQSLRVPEKRWPVVLFGAAVVMAFMTKQTAGIVLPVALLHAVCSKAGRRWLLRPITIVTGGLIAAIVLAYGSFAAPYTALPEKLLAWSPDVAFYAMHLPEMIGWPLTVVALLGCAFFCLNAIGKERHQDDVPDVNQSRQDEDAIAESMQVAAASLHQDRQANLRPVSRIESQAQRESAIPQPLLFSRPLLLLAIWLFAWWAFSSAIAAKEPRYFFFALPPFFMMAGQGWIDFAVSFTNRIGMSGGISAPFKKAVASTPFPSQGEGRWHAERFKDSHNKFGRGKKVDIGQNSIRRIAFALIAFGFTAQAFFTVRAHPGNPPSYQPAVDALMARGDADLVLIDAVRDGQFVYDLYANQQARGSLIPLRASKLLYARAARMKYAGIELVQSQDDIVNVLDQYGVRYVVMESRLPETHYTDADPRPRRLLRELVQSDERFVRRGAWPLACRDAAWDEVALWLIEYTDCPPRQRDTVDIPVPAIGKTVTIKLGDAAR